MKIKFSKSEVKQVGTMLIIDADDIYNEKRKKYIFWRKIKSRVSIEESR